jgi:predicted SnoaL-like aldol condensation-catalyzing enzyme
LAAAGIIPIWLGWAGSRACAQVPVVPVSDPGALLASADPVLKSNKRIVFDFWRVVLEAGHLELADRYLRKDYIQHNPGVPTGRDGFVAFFKSHHLPRKPLEPALHTPIVSIVAERDLVVVICLYNAPFEGEPSRAYTTVRTDMFRIDGGKIAEHWDNNLQD